MQLRARTTLSATVLFTVLILISSSVHAQEQTVGLFLNDSKAAEGYTLWNPLSSPNTYLIDNYGHLVHSWTNVYNPASSVYLLEDGNLLRTARVEGKGGGMEKVAWDGSIVWHFEYFGDNYITHHDITPLPNGNALMIVRFSMTEAEALAAGRDPALLTSNGLNTESIIEVMPTGPTSGEIVWEWHAWDHFIQDYDAGQANYGVVNQHPELVNINFDDDNRAEWLHANGIAYNADLDQIAISHRNISEIWVIDHSTTTEEAAGHTGGNNGKGGDLIYRWGNPAAYGGGLEAGQQLFHQHNVHWIAPGLPGAGNLLIFSNDHVGTYGNYSTIVELVTPVDGSGAYTTPAPGSAFGPVSPVWTYEADPPEDFFSSKISGSQRQANGNTLICEGNGKRFFEVTVEGEMVWEYISPEAGGEPMLQGETGSSNVFRCYRYPSDYPGLAGKDLTPGATLEIYPVTISGTSHTPVDPSELESVTVTTTVTDYVPVLSVELRYDIGSGFTTIMMFDDGLHGDGAAGDDVFGATIPAQPTGINVSYYIYALDPTGGATDPANPPITTYRYGTPGAGLSSNGITLIEQQTNFPILTEATVPTPGNPWTWTVSALSGFAGAPSVWFEYQDADQTVADLRWSGFESSDWLSGVDGDFSLTLSNGVDPNIEYTLYLSLRSLLYDGIAVFEKQTAGGAMFAAPGLYGFDVTADNFDWGGSLPPTAASLTMDADGQVTGHDFGDGPWDLDGTFRLKLKDGARPVSHVPGQALALRHLLPDTLTVINEGTSGNAIIQVDGAAEMWDWSFITDGLPVSEIGAANANNQATYTLAWLAGALLDGETGTGSISLIRSDGSAPESFVALPIVVEASSCCISRVGDANGSGDDEPTIGDISVLIDAKFIAGTCDGIISCLDEADINQSGLADPTCEDITIGDISFLIDYLFITGPSLGLPDCL